MQQTAVEFPPRWANASGLEQILGAAPSDLLSTSPEVRLYVPKGCQLMTDAAVGLLCLLHRLDHSTRRVVVQKLGLEGEAIGVGEATSDGPLAPRPQAKKGV